MKSEPHVYPWNQLKIDGRTNWDGVRTYQARNIMRDDMSMGDLVLFYHSNCKPPGIVGMMEVIKTELIDPTQFDLNSKYYDQKSKVESPRWDCAQMKYIGTFKNSLSLQELKGIYSPEELQVIRKGNRLSIMPIISATAEDLLKRLGKPVP